MKSILFAFSILISTASFATEVVTKELDQQGKTLAVALANTFDVPLSSSGPCTGSEFTVSSTVEGFEPPVFKVQTRVDDINVTIIAVDGAAKSISELLDLAGVPGNRTGYTTFVRELSLKAKSCGFSPNYWTGSYQIFGPDWK
ncbi:MAG TPA: hypothetical protein VNJ01_07435 [Bacteriovoracaceae bacterium]|nr:hypothetical protein [Bacteriovoracaceae bacterium]